MPIAYQGHYQLSTQWVQASCGDRLDPNHVPPVFWKTGVLTAQHCKGLVEVLAGHLLNVEEPLELQLCEPGWRPSSRHGNAHLLSSPKILPHSRWRSDHIWGSCNGRLLVWAMDGCSS